MDDGLVDGEPDDVGDDVVVIVVSDYVFGGVDGSGELGVGVKHIVDFQHEEDC